MRRTITPVLGIAAAVALAAAVAPARAFPAVPTSPAAAPSAADTLTGCLQKGEKTGTYKLVEQNGQSVNIKSSSTNLRGHVGHMVKVVTPASHMNMSGDSTVLSVSKLSMVAPKCTTS